MVSERLRSMRLSKHFIIQQKCIFSYCFTVFKIRDGAEIFQNGETKLLSLINNTISIGFYPLPNKAFVSMIKMLNPVLLTMGLLPSQIYPHYQQRNQMTHKSAPLSPLSIPSTFSSVILKIMSYLFPTATRMYVRS